MSEDSYNWYEDEVNYTHVGSCEFGHNSVNFFEVYQDNTTKELIVMEHDDPDFKMDIDGLIDFSSGYVSDPKYKEQADEFNKLMVKLRNMEFHKVVKEELA